MAVKRRVKKHVSLTGIDLPEWQSDPKLLVWAQSDKRFLMVLTVLINEKMKALKLHHEEGLSDSRILGRSEGYGVALWVLGEMARGKKEGVVAEQEVSYAADEEVSGSGESKEIVYG